MSIQLGACEINGAFGPMASGKTFLIEQWLKSGYALANRYVRFDATGETLDQEGVEHIWQSPKSLYERLTRNPYYFRICYHPGQNLREEFRYALQCLWRVDQFKLLVMDEFHEVCSVNETPDYVQTMLRYARHNHLAVIAASQRIADVHKLFTAGCRKVVIFRSDESRDFIAVRDRWGLEAAEAMSNLRPLIYDDEKRITRQVPQCLVCPKGQRPFVYDFKSEEVLPIGRLSESFKETEGQGSEESGRGQLRSDSESDSPNPSLSEGQENNSPATGKIQREDSPSPAEIEPGGGNS